MAKKNGLPSVDGLANATASVIEKQSSEDRIEPIGSIDFQFGFASNLSFYGRVDAIFQKKEDQERLRQVFMELHNGEHQLNDGRFVNSKTDVILYLLQNFTR